MSINALLNIGQNAIVATQVATNTIGNNIANVNTPGYSRQYVRFEDNHYINKRPGAQGQGVNAAEVLRYFNKFVESSFVQKSGVASRWNEQANHMSTVENLFNEANRLGVSSQMTNYFTGWEELSKNPDLIAARQDLVSKADSLSLLLRDATANLKQVQRDMDSAIRYDVTRANDLIKDIASLNKEINMTHVDGMSNANGLMDKRDTMTRELALIMDVKIDDRGAGDYYVQTQNGMPLVAGTEHFEIAVLPPKAEFAPSANSAYDGEIEFSGTDSHEYTVHFTQGGDVTSANPPKFKISLDGGQTFLRDEDNNVIEYDVTGTDDGTGNIIVDPIKVKNLEISFSEADGFTADDKFTITPKAGLYWVEPTRGAVNITPQIFFNGTDNGDRLTGGTLAALFNVRDDNCGRYLDEINAITASLIWETNYRHSQGSGLEKLAALNGTESVNSADAPLGTAKSGLNFWDKLSDGTMAFNIYNKDTGALIEGKTLDFGTGVPGDPVVLFDPKEHSLNDVQEAINRTFNGQLKAEIIDGKLNIDADNAADPPVSFHVIKDATGVLAGLGLNTFFQGFDANDISVNANIRENLNLINAGSVDSVHSDSGDSATATLIAKFATEDISISTVWKRNDGQTLTEYYSSFVATVGSDSRSAKTNRDYNVALATDLDNKQAASSGVNLNEEMTSLIKFQHSYNAAAKLITTADQMLQTLLSLKQ